MRLQRFLESQQVQGPRIVVPTEWLHVSHVDEAFSFWGGHVFVADPDRAFDVLRASASALGGRAVVFATGATPITGTVREVSGSQIRIHFDQKPGSTRWSYMRVCDGAGKGQVARVSPGEIVLNEDDEATVSVARSWWTGFQIQGPPQYFVRISAHDADGIS